MTVRLPLRTPLGGLPYREVVLVQGPSGWGEMSPLPGYPCDPARARAAAEEAACGTWPPARRESIPVNAIVPAVGPDEAAAMAAGHATVKVKVGDPGDVDRVAAVRGAIGPSGRIRVDANGAWDVDTALATIARLAPFDLEMVEQPVASMDDMAAVRRRLTAAIPIAADECVRSVADAVRLRRLEAADVIVLKVQPLGGVAAALAVAEAADLPALVSSMFESSIGLAAGLALAAALPDLPYACGLGSALLLACDVVSEPLVPVDGWLPVRRVAPDPELLERFSVAG
ncbi:MAG: o-succinylbenzoate synthase [Actinomycetota bacterium]|nr:o-succinylbenzoate synthase [Actinomycetota bacterium]